VFNRRKQVRLRRNKYRTFTICPFARYFCVEKWVEYVACMGVVNNIYILTGKDK
jgi:hypothetical protein